MRISRRCGKGRALSLLLVGCAAFSLTLLPRVAPADEGMWPPFLLDKSPIDTWHARGLELSAKDIYSPQQGSLSDAIVQLGGGTASFVSFDGLIATNHHVAFGALQRTSSVGSDYITEGFLAGEMSEEIPAPGYEALVLLGVEDVTKKVLGSIKDGMTDQERYKATEKVSKELIAEAEKGKDVYCQVSHFYDGGQYCLYTYFKIKDIRIVYAPPRSIGEFGGDIDNWMWPRHTGDFSFMRAYVAPDGKSAEYAKENVPYHPKRHLAISVAPLKDGDFTMVMGYPGRTARYRPSASIDFTVNRYLPASIQMSRDLIDILDQEMKRGREVGIKVASLHKGLNNSYKNNVGMLEGLKKSNLLAQKIEQEKELVQYLEANPDLQKKYGHVLGEIKAQYDENLKFWKQTRLLGYLSYASSSMRSAIAIYKWSVEREKTDLDRDPGYQDRDQNTVRKRLEIADLSYEEQADKRILKYLIMALAKCDQTYGGVEGIKPGISESEIDQMLARMYAGTKVTDKEERMKMFGMSKKQLHALNDPMIEFAAKVHARVENLEKHNEAFAGALEKLNPQLIELRAKHRGGLLYPDANGTMRIAAGQVKGYSPADAVQYHWLTTLSGVVAKTTGEGPFDTPQKLVQLHQARDFGRYVDKATGDVPVCFLSTDDLTGGNSGSPVLNGRGEMVGLVFDGNYEAISSDYQFIPDLTRSINVDSRYMLFILDKFAGAEKLLSELEITGGPGSPAGTR
jgi:hypothetical protein